MTLRQDGHRLRDEQAVGILTLVRKMVLNLLRADLASGSQKVKRKHLGWSDTYPVMLLTQSAKYV